LGPIPGHVPPLRCLAVALIGDTTLGRTPLDEGSTRPMNICLTTHNAHERQNTRDPGGVRTYIIC